MTKDEQMMAMTLSANLLNDTINDTIQRNDLEMITRSEDKIKVRAYIMT
jgi:hypothetical protein